MACNVIDNTCKLYVTNNNNHCIQVVTDKGEYVTRFGTKGDGKLESPTGVCIDKGGTVYVVDYSNNRVCLFRDTTSNNDYVCFKKFGSEGSAPGLFHEPWGIALDKKENIYVTDIGNNRIQIF